MNHTLKFQLTIMYLLLLLHLHSRSTQVFFVYILIKCVLYDRSYDVGSKFRKLEIGRSSHYILFAV